MYVCMYVCHEGWKEDQLDESHLVIEHQRLVSVYSFERANKSARWPVSSAKVSRHLQGLFSQLFHSRQSLPKSVQTVINCRKLWVFHFRKKRPAANLIGRAEAPTWIISPLFLSWGRLVKIWKLGFSQIYLFLMNLFIEFQGITVFGKFCFASSLIPSLVEIRSRSFVLFSSYFS